MAAKPSKGLIVNSATCATLWLSLPGFAWASDAAVSPASGLGEAAQAAAAANTACDASANSPDGVPAYCATTRSNIVARSENERASIEVYGSRLHATTAPYTPDRLLITSRNRDFENTALFVTGIKASALDQRFKVKAEFVRTQRVVQDLLADDHRSLNGQFADHGTSASVRFDALVADSDRFKWSFAGEYKIVSDDYAVGQSTALLRYHAMPGTRMSLTTAARLGTIRLNAGLGLTKTPLGESALRKAGIDLDGISLRLVSRESELRPFTHSGLKASRSHSQSLYADLDFHLLAANLLPGVGELPPIVPNAVNFTYRTGGTTRAYSSGEERSRLRSFGIDGIWETALGDTMVSYWRDTRVGLTPGARSRWNETLSVDHSLKWGRWRFSADAAMTRGNIDGGSSYRERSWSFGQSIAYSAPNGPELRIHLGQDRGKFRTIDESYLSDDRYSQITASLDLSPYLQKRYERDDLQLRLDYRKTVDRSDSEFLIDNGIIDHWIDEERREGLLISFGMKL